MTFNFHQSPLIKKNGNKIIFVVLLFSVALLYNYHHILFYRPYSIHQWRQADCLSITMNYYMENRNFFEPCVHWLSAHDDGKTVSEFPVIYYLVSKLWKIFGLHEFIFRLLNISIVFTGLFCFHRLIEDILNNFFWATLITLLLFASPILVFYTNNFTMDAPALGLAFIACYLFWKGYINKNKTAFYISFLIFLLAGLLKVSSLLSFVAIFIVHLYLVISNKNKNEWFFKWYSLLPYIIVVLIVFSWYKYAVYYNSKYVSGVFLTGIYPIWELDRADILNIWNMFQKDLLPAYFNKIALDINLILFFALFFFYKKMNKVLLALNVLVFTGAVLYIILFYKALNVHDYYLINLLVFFPLPIIAWIEMLGKNHPQVLHSKYLKVFSVAALLVLMYQTTVINRLKYSTDDFIVKNNIAAGKMEMEYWDWYHYDYKLHAKAYETITPYLRSIGLKRTDRVLCLPDISINVSLYLMDQKGFTAFGYSDFTFDQRINFYKKRGVEYLITDSSYFNSKDYLAKYVGSKIGNYQNINIYKLK